jgi:hypothetical protein
MADFLVLAKYGRCCVDRFQRRGETGINGHLQNDLQDLVGSATDVQGTAKMIFQVGLRIGDEQVLVTAGGDVIRVSDGTIIAKRQFRLGHNSPIVKEGVVYTLEDGAIKAWQLPRTFKGEFKLEQHWQAENTRANQ